jgi:peptidoglycan/LPS O-acetylase OafA/YrhL
VVAQAGSEMLDCCAAVLDDSGLAIVTETANSYRKDYIATLDGLRASAVLLVLWQHIPNLALPLVAHNCNVWLFGPEAAGTWPLQIDWLRDHVFAAGYLGVDVFFVLSGFLITRILLVDRAQQVPLGHFLMRRVLRIFPIYYLTLAVVWWVAPHAELKWCAFYLSNFYYLFHSGGVMQHSWSLAVEEHFYLLWPLLVYSVSAGTSRRIAAWVLVPGAVLSAVGLAFYWRHDLRFVLQASQYGTMFRMASLSLGALLAFSENWLRHRATRTLGLACAMLAAGTTLRFWLTTEVVGTWIAPLRILSFGFTSTSLVMACIALNQGNSILAKWLRSAPMRFIGRISYGLYLYHNVVYHWIGLYEPAVDLQQLPVAGLLASAVAVTFLVATLSYYGIERPCLRWANRFRRA